jgi:hypothetical protein
MKVNIVGVGSRSCFTLSKLTLCADIARTFLIIQIRCKRGCDYKHRKAALFLPLGVDHLQTKLSDCRRQMPPRNMTIPSERPIGRYVLQPGQTIEWCVRRRKVSLENLSEHSTEPGQHQPRDSGYLVSCISAEPLLPCQ